MYVIIKTHLTLILKGNFLCENVLILLKQQTWFMALYLLCLETVPTHGIAEKIVVFQKSSSRSKPLVSLLLLFSEAGPSDTKS